MASTDRCGVGSSSDAVDARGFYFDPLHGSLYLSFVSFCLQVGSGACNYGGVWLARIDGFTPLADVLPPAAPQCSNGIDDDGDGAVDTDDCSCKSAVDNDESPAWGKFQRWWTCRPPHATPH